MPSFSADVRNPSAIHTAQWRANPPVWAVWEYEPGEWEAFDAGEWRRGRQAAWRVARPYVLIGAAAIVVIAAGAAVAHDPAWLVFCLGPLWLCGIAGLLNGGSRWSEAERLHRGRLAGPRTVEITPIAVRIGATGIPLVDRQLVLRRTWMVAGDPVLLCFHLTLYSRSPMQTEVRVPVPHGREEEARQLAARFAAQVV